MGMRPRRDGKPAVWGWYVAYCACMALMYLGVAGMGIFLANAPFPPRPPDAPPAPDPAAMASLFIALGIVFCIPFAAGPFLPRKPWAWVVGCVLICIGMTSLCCLVVCIPLLLQWIKPETKAWFSGIDAAPISAPPRGRQY